MATTSDDLVLPAVTMDNRLGREGKDWKLHTHIKTPVLGKRLEVQDGKVWCSQFQSSSTKFAMPSLIRRLIFMTDSGFFNNFGG